MPVTPSHVVAVLPLWPVRQWLPFSALVIGAMVPDFGLFFGFVDYAQTHSFAGVFTACLPLGFGITLLFEVVMRRPLRALLPNWVQHRIDPTPQVPSTVHPSTCLVFVAGLSIAVLIGSFSHVAWDAFTHQGRWGTHVFPRLNSVITIFGYSVPGYKALQYVSGLLGAPVIAAFFQFLLQPKHAPETPVRERTLRIRRLAATLTFTVPLAVGIFAAWNASSISHAMGVTVTISSAILMVAALAYCVVYQWTESTGADV